MTNRYIIQKRQNSIIYSELFILAIGAAYYSFEYLKIHPAISVLIGFAVLVIIGLLFFISRFFRYFFSIVFSLAWAYLAYGLGYAFDKDQHITAWVVGGIAFLICILAHWDHFTFLKNAKRIEYDKY